MLSSLRNISLSGVEDCFTPSTISIMEVQLFVLMFFGAFLFQGEALPSIEGNCYLAIDENGDGNLAEIKMAIDSLIKNICS